MEKRKMAIFLAGSLAFANMTACAEETEREGASRKAEIVVVSITGNELTYYEVEDESEEAKTVYLPVAAPVHADTDETMTFSILEDGDELEVLLEEKDGEEIITEIWLLNAADAGAGAGAPDMYAGDSNFDKAVE